MSFESDFLGGLARFEDATNRLEDYVRYVLDAERVLFHAVNGRTKSLKSALRKQAMKRYSDPLSEMTDIIGARVYTYFREDSREVERVLRKHFELDESRSLNKADVLDFKEFGYTSRHLIMTAGLTTGNLQLKSALNDMPFEIQIRSVLEHGWAEVEHELVYKAGTKAPECIRRRFASTAATIELVEREFAMLRQFESDLIADRVQILQSDVPHGSLDRAWFVAVLKAVYPGRQSWSPVPSNDNFYHGMELELLGVLQSSGIETVPQWYELVSDARVSSGINMYCLGHGLALQDVNHLPISVLACGLAAPGVADLSFVDSGLAQIMADLWKP